ncbi:hypothetical protein AAU57_08535 [Nonlabens sp. YIK11]|nr:hypothetical protein AAU57_08535 [Nonlabens sp. YIK11]
MISVSNGVWAQDEMIFEPLTGKETIGQSITYDIIQEESGMLWIATEEGVLKHNSIDFTIYNTNKGLEKTLGNQVSQIFQDQNGEIWIGTSKGIGRYNVVKDIFESVDYSGNVVPTLVTSIVQHPENGIYALDYNGLWRYDESSQQMVQKVANSSMVDMAIFDNVQYLISSNTIYRYDDNLNALQEIYTAAGEEYSFISQANGMLFIGTADGELLQWDRNKLVSLFKGTGNVRSLIFDSGAYYLGLDGSGVYELSNDFSLRQVYNSDEDDPNSISNDGVYKIIKGKDERYWVTTYGGGVLAMRPKSPFSIYKHELNNDNSLKSNYVRSVVEDQQGNIWFGTKKGISVLEVATQKWTHLTSLNRSGTNTIVTALAVQNENVYIGTYNHGFFKINSRTLSITDLSQAFENSNAASIIYDILISENGDVLTTGLRGTTAIFRNDAIIETIPIPNGRALREVSSTEILLVTRLEVFKINPKTQEFKSIGDLKSSEAVKFSNLQDAISTNGNYYLASNGAGIVRIDPSGNLSSISIKDGMPSNTVLAFLNVNDSELWASTTRGLARLINTPGNTQVFTYDNFDGSLNNEFIFNSATQLQNGKLAFGSTDGAIIFQPREIPITAQVPNIELDELFISNEKIDVGESPLSTNLNQLETLSLGPDQNSIEISFVGITFQHPETITYQFMLEGFDKNWSQPDSQNFATYTNLEYGDYVFKVRAINKYGKQSSIKELKITISPPWYLTNLAIVTYVILFCFFSYIIFHFTRILIKKKNADEQIAFFNNITHEIKTPLAVLMSSLDRVTTESPDKDESRKRIKKTVQRINSLFEQLLNFHKVTSQNSIEQHLKEFDIKHHVSELVDDFKPMTQERNISISLNTDLTNSHFYHDRDILDKVVLNILSNAIKYSNDGDHIDIFLSNVQNGDLKIQIVDQGIGIPKDQQKFILKNYYRANNAVNSQRPGTGLGLVMVQKLIEKSGGTISFTSKENEGTIFTMILKNYKEAFTEKESQRVIVDPTLIDKDDALQDELNSLSDSKILVVEDNDDLRNLMVENLARYFQVFEAANGEEGLEVAHQQFPDLILTDLIMPVMDGMEMSRKLKGDINLNHIPVFMLTVLQNSTQKLDSLQSGITEYLEKPVNYKLLLAKIINTLNYQKQLRKRYMQEKDSNNAAIFKNEKDQEFLQNLEKNIIDHLDNDEFTVHDLAAKMGMSRTSLYMKLKNLVDLSPQDFIITTKLKLAKKLLIETDLSIKEVAFRCGFTSPKYFSTSFKKFYDMTPTGFLDSLK